jgi:hypothetical protein
MTRSDFEFSAAHPIKDQDQDRLAHWPLAQELANAIRRSSPKNGFVVGIEGGWGSGKSSIANLVERHLNAVGENRHKIVRFNPWLVGTRDQLLGELFAELIRAAAEFGAPPGSDLSLWRIDHWWHRLRLWVRLRKLTANQRQWFILFAELAKRLGQLGAVGVALGVVDPITAGALFAGAVGDQAMASPKQQSLVEIKSAINGALRALSGHLVVIVDDMDRLEPAEAVEVLRLIRAVVDFSNTTYILCYDREVLASALQSELGISDGSEFLKKVVQLPFPVPRPEAFRLRRWFNDELARAFPDQLNALQTAADRDNLDRLTGSIDQVGGRYLKTPRDVALILNSILLRADSVRDMTDFADLVWLCFIRHGAPDLFHWIEGYMIDVAALANGAGASDQEKSKLVTDLQRILGSDGHLLELQMHDLAERLPGLSRNVLPAANEAKWDVLENISRQRLGQFIAKKRLGSPDHHRAYFAFAYPEGSIPETEVAEFLRQLASDPTTAKATFQSASQVLLTENIPRAERLLDQIVSTGDLDTKSTKVLMECIVDSLDDAARTAGPGGFFGGYAIWRIGERFLKQSLPKLPPHVRVGLPKELYSNGRALGFLADLLRHETFAHGVYGDQAKPESEWIVNEGEFEEIKTVFWNRLMNKTASELILTPELLSLLFGWLQLGATTDVRIKVAELTSSDDQLLEFLMACRGWRATSTNGQAKLLRPLRRSELANFLDVDKTIERLSVIVADSDLSETKRSQARELIAALDLSPADASSTKS